MDGVRQRPRRFRCFACTQCHDFIDVGIAHVFIDRMGIGVGSELDAARILDDRLLRRLVARPGMKSLGRTYEFLEKHRGHRLMYWDNQTLPERFDLDWLNVASAEPTPRFYVEVLKMKSWDNLLEWRSALGWEWSSNSEREEFQQAFESHLARFRRTQ